MDRQVKLERCTIPIQLTSPQGKNTNLEREKINGYHLHGVKVRIMITMAIHNYNHSHC